MSGSVAGLQVQGLNKSYGGAHALQDMNLQVAPGEVHALLGQNGCGKSTLVKSLTGVITPDAGTVTWNGRRLAFPITDPHKHGIAVIHQDIGLVDSMTVLENLAISAGFGSRILGAVKWKNERAIYADLMARLQVHCSLDSRVSDLSPAERALLGVVRALRLMDGESSRQLFILDEPTASLPQSEALRVLALMRTVADAGSAVVFISHRLAEVMQVCDSATIMRGGTDVMTGPMSAMSREEVVSHMLGRRMDEFYPAPPPVRTSEPRLVVRGLAGRKIKDLSFELGPGEVVGVTGLAGMGQEELPMLLAGAAPVSAGSATLDGKPALFRNAAQGIAAGVVLVPGNRLRDGIWTDGSAEENVTLPVLQSFAGPGGLKDRALAAHARGLLEAVAVRPNNPELPLSAFSGGNQQKIVFAKWLQLRPQVLLLDEPTQGVDPGAAKELLNDAMKLAAGGSSILVCSSDHEQLAAICHRVIVLHHGQAVAELSGNELTEHALLQACEIDSPALLAPAA